MRHENYRKLVKDDSGATSGDTSKVSDALLFCVYGATMSDNQLVQDTSGPCYIAFVITLPKNDDQAKW